jgi:carbon storage regulator
MLVLSRKVGEQVTINNEITVTLLGIEGKRVRLGFDAPKEIPIVRKELADLLDRSHCAEAAPFGTDGAIQYLVDSA